MATRMQQRKGTAAQWISTNSGNGPVLNAGEIGFELDTNKFKIGDGINHWVDLVYFTDSASALAAINSVIDAAPAALNTLNELAAAINDDPAFFTTIATNLSNHQSDTTNIHGIADTSLLATKAYADNAVSVAVGTLVDSAPDLLNTLNEIAAAIGDDPAFITTVAGQLSNHQTDTTNIHGIPDTANLETQTGAQSKINTAVDNHSSDTTNIHGIADTSALETQDGAQSKVDAHNSDTTNVHGITDTSVLETQSGAQSKVDTAVSNHNSDTTNVHGIADTSALATQTNVSDAVSTHNSDTTNIHGIADTAQLATTSDTASAISTAVSDHNSDTTNVHGIANTADLATISYVDESVGDATVDQSLLAGVGIDWNVGTEQFDIDSTVSTKTYADDAVSTHNSDTTNVHGIADTSVLETTSGAQSKVDTHSSDTTNVHGIVDTAQIATKAYSDDAVSTHNSDTTDVHGIANTADLATKNYADSAVSTHQSDTTSVHGIADTSALALTSDVNDSISSAISTHNSDSTNVHGIDDTAALATKTYVAGLLVNSTKTNITITGDLDGLTINAENGVADSTTDFLTEGTNNLYFTTERAQDAVGNSVGTGLTYTDATGEIKVDTAVVQTRVTNITDTEIGYLDGLSSNIQTQIDTKAALVSPTFTGTVSGITKSMVGLGNVDNTSDANKPVSTAQASAIATAKSEAIADATSQVNAVIAGAPSALNTLDELAAALGDDANFAATLTTTLAAKAPLDAPTFTGTVSGITKSMVGLGNVDNTSDANKPISSATQTALDAKLASSTAASTYAPIASPTFTGTVAGITKSMVGLGNVDNTTDANKPVSTATQTELDLKAPLANPTFTGTVSGISKSMVGLANVDNTTDANKPVSTATQTALDSKLNLAGGTMTGALTLSGAPTLSLHAATKAYVDSAVEGLHVHASVKAATTANITLATAVENGDTLDGVTLATGDRILVKNQTTTSQNGIYIVAASGAPTRATDFDTAAEVDSGDFVFVDQGTTQANSGWVQINTPATIGTDAIEFVQFSGAGTYLAGSALTLTGNTFSIADGAITSAKIENGTIVDADVSASAAIAQSKISGLTSDLAAKAPINNPTFTGTVAGITKSMVGLANVDNTSDVNKPVSTATQTALDAKLATSTAASTYAPLASPTFTGTVTLPTGTVTSGMILDGTIVNDDISATAAIAQSKISGLTTSLGLKADLASPAFTGTPTAPTAASGTNTTQVATTAFVGTAVADLVASAPSALNTLNELATALGNDANFSTTVTTSLASKAPLASPTFTGTATIPTLTLTNPLSAANGGTGLSSLGTGVATFLGTPSSANLAAMITDEIGTGNIVLSEISTSSQTASYTLVAADRGKLVEMNVGSANNLTVPLDSSVNFPTGTQIDILQVGSGQTTVVATVGVTINGTPGLKIRAQWGGATLIKRAANTWVLIGDLTA